MIDPSLALMAFLFLPIFLYMLVAYYYPLWRKALGKENVEVKRQLCIDPEPEMCKVCPDNGKACIDLPARSVDKNKV